MVHKIPKLGIGIGLRRQNSEDLVKTLPSQIECLEVAPENYIDTGGKYYREFCQLAEHYPMVFHGLSLSIGSLKPINWEFLKKIKQFLKQFKAKTFSDHLCYSSVMGAQFHDLLPLPFTQEAIDHVVPRIKQVQDFFEMPFAMENISYYAHPGEPEMKEWEFVRQVVEQADCSLLFDVNNIYVNSVNHRFDPYTYVDAMPLERVEHVHVAGHRQVQDFLLDTHGAKIIDPVWDLLKYTAQKTELPTIIIERDNNVPPLRELIQEAEHTREICSESML